MVGLSWVLMAGQIVIAVSFFIIFNYLQNQLKKPKASADLAKSEPLGQAKPEGAKSIGKTEFDQLKKENLEFKNKLSNKEKELEQAVSRCLLAGEEQKNRGKILEALKEENKELQGELSGKDEELEKAAAQKLELEAEYKRQVEMLGALERDNRELSSKFKNLSAQINLELDKLNQENSELRNKLSSKESELESVVSQKITLEDQLKKQSESFEAFRKEKEEAAVKLKEPEKPAVKIDSLIEAQEEIRAESIKKEKEPAKAIKEEETKAKERRERPRDHKRKMIGEILLENNFISKDILEKALKYQDDYGTSITQYLLGYGYINEQQLAQCICTQFNIPYLPLKSYAIRDEIIKLIPVDIAEKYWLVPVEKMGDSLMVVMADPRDAQTIKEIEEITGLKVQPFVGILSEIIEALEGYYKVTIKDREPKSKKSSPFFIDTNSYSGPERRKAIRFAANLDIYYPVGDDYKKSVAKNISRESIFFESETNLNIASLVPLQIELPKDFYPLPIVAVVQVARVTALDNGKFGIGARVIKIAKPEIDAVIRYVSALKA